MSIKLTLTVNLDNAAFQDGTCSELARVLRVAADKVEGFATGGKLLDVNGNTVGKFAVR